MSEPIPLPDLLTLPDEALVAGAGDESSRAFAVLMRRYNPRMFRAARGILWSDADAEEAVQTAWIQAWHHMDDLRDGGAVGTWLTRIAVREALQAKRRGRRIHLVPEVPEHHDAVRHPASASVEDRAAARELVALVEASIDALPEAYRVVVMLRSVEGMSVAETAEVLDLHQTTVKTRLHRARRLLREALGDRLEEEISNAFLFLGERCDRIVAAVFQELHRYT